MDSTLVKVQPDGTRAVSRYGSSCTRGLDASGDPWFSGYRTFALHLAQQHEMTLGWNGGAKGPQTIGRSRGGWITQIHKVAKDARTAITFSLTPRPAHDAPEGAQLAESI